MQGSSSSHWVGWRKQANSQTGGFHVRSDGSDGGQVAEALLKIKMLMFCVVAPVDLTEKNKQDLQKNAAKK